MNKPQAVQLAKISVPSGVLVVVDACALSEDHFLKVVEAADKKRATIKLGKITAVILTYEEGKKLEVTSVKDATGSGVVISEME